MGAGAEAVGGGDAALEVAGVRLDFVSTLEPPISAVVSIFSSFLPGIVLASPSLGEEEVLSSVALLESPVSPFDLPLLLSLLDLLDEAELCREPFGYEMDSLKVVVMNLMTRLLIPMSRLMSPRSLLYR